MMPVSPHRFGADDRRKTIVRQPRLVPVRQLTGCQLEELVKRRHTHSSSDRSRSIAHSNSSSRTTRRSGDSLIDSTSYTPGMTL